MVTNPDMQYYGSQGHMYTTMHMSETTGWGLAPYSPGIHLGSP